MAVETETVRVGTRTCYCIVKRRLTNVYTFKCRLTEFNFYRFFCTLLLYLFYYRVICVYFCDDVSGCFYPFVNTID